MSGIVATMPPATQAAILRHVGSARYPKLEIPTIAARHHITLADLQTLLQHHGYPNFQAMMTALRKLENAVTHPPTSTSSSDDADQAAGGVLSKVKLTQLHADPENPRDELRGIEDLADSTVSIGLLQPIIARRVGSILYVVAGHRRLAAARHLQWDEVDCIVRTDIRPDDVLAAMLIENGQRSDLDPIEEARGLHKLKTQHGYSDMELAKAIGRSQPVVSSRLALLSLSAEEQEQVRNGGMKLVEAAHKGRLNSGKLGPTGQDKGWHLGPSHDLATRAKARCVRLKHARGRTVGGMACGECWESVIRADEREHLHTISNELGACTLCGTKTPKAAS